MRTIAVIALKGGSGKTTVATHLALAAHRRGFDALVLDTDPQRSSKDVLNAREAPGPDCEAIPGGRILTAQFDAVNAGRNLLIIDTAAGAVEDVSEALVLADLAVMVCRPTMLDLAGLVRSLAIVKKLGKPALVVLNQAPAPRETVESPLVKRILKGLAFMQAPLCPIILRARTVYQLALERGRSAEEMTDPAAAMEVAALWDFIEAKVALPPAKTKPA